VGSVRSLPGGVRDAITKQLEGLPNDTRRALSVASAVGRDFLAAAVADAIGMPTRELLALIRPAVDARLVISGSDPSAHFRFAHVSNRPAWANRLRS
jgi:hypothetical protein